MLVLGIETSCDDTGIAIVDDKRNIIYQALASQIDLHKQYGGVVPELAARNHISNLQILTEVMISDKHVQSLDEIDAFAATTGPGLIVGLLVGSCFAKTLSLIYKKPFISIHHLEAHLLTTRLFHPELQFPFLGVILSGGHCQIVIAKDLTDYKIVGATIDDSIGETFDKVAKMLGLEYPGGPKIEQLAKSGDKNKFNLPRPLVNQNNCNFSFSGLKTAVLHLIIKLSQGNFSNQNTNLTDHINYCADNDKSISDSDKHNICASFQKTVTDILIKKISIAMTLYQNYLNTNEATMSENNMNKDAMDKNRQHQEQQLDNQLQTNNNNLNIKNLVICGGVAANQYIRSAINNLAQENNYQTYYAPIEYCTDNGVMIAWNGIEYLKNNIFHSPTSAIRSKWDMEELKTVKKNKTTR